jgi:hypothetical protein
MQKSTIKFFLKKTWSESNFKFVFIPSFFYSGKSNSKLSNRAFTIIWLCFSLIFECDTERLQMDSTTNNSRLN